MDQVATTTCTKWGTISINGSQYIYQQNEWNSNLTQCVSVDDTTGAWTITQANFNLPNGGAPATYPSTFRGCHWGNCSTNSDLPIQVSALSSATSSWSTTQISSGAYNVAYDLWTNTTPTTSGQPNGSEIMIWLNSRGGISPAGQIVGTVTISGVTWNVWTTRMSGWNYIAYQRLTGTTSVSNLDIKAFVQDSVNRGSTNSSWYLLDAEAGFEIWQGGQGLGTNSFSFSASTGAPSTKPATNVASFSASLNGSVDPNGLATTVYFQYGTTTSYGHTTTPQTQTGSTYRNVTANISGLSANTTYHFRNVATNSGGTRYGADRTFTTLSPTGPPVSITNPATLIASFSATLNGTLDPHGLTTTVHFQYGTTTSYGLTTAQGSMNGNMYQSVAANINGLAAGTTYHFRIVATNSAGTRNGADRTFTTLSATGAPGYDESGDERNSFCSHAQCVTRSARVDHERSLSIRHYDQLRFHNAQPKQGREHVPECQCQHQRLKRRRDLSFPHCCDQQRRHKVWCGWDVHAAIGKPRLRPPPTPSGFATSHASSTALAAG